MVFSIKNNIKNIIAIAWLLRSYGEAIEIFIDIYITFMMSIKYTRFFKKMKRII
jgi:hypothetical protein